MSCQLWSLHGFQTSHFICYWFGCKLWLWSIQSYARHCFQAFACSLQLCHLKWLHCSIWIWADSLSSDRSLIQTRCFAQESIQNMRFCSFVMFLPWDQWMIERLSEAMGAGSAALVCNKFSPIPSKFHFTRTKKWLVAAWILLSIKTLLTLELSQYCKSGIVFSSSKQVATSRDCSSLGYALCLCSPVRPAAVQRKQSRRAAPRAWQLILPSNPLITFWNSLGEITRWLAGAQTWTQTWTLPPDQRVVKVL